MRLSYKIVVIIITLTVLFAVMSTLIVSRVIQNRIHQENLAWGRVLTDSLATAISEFVVNRDVLYVRNVLREVVHNRQKIGYAYVTDFDGEVMAHTFGEGFPQVLLEKLDNPDYRHDPFVLITGSKAYLDVSYHMIEGMKAHIHIGIDRAAETLLLNSVRRDIILISSIVGALGALLALFMGRRLTRPLANLVDNIRAYSRGEYRTVQLAGANDIEIDEVARAFNEMLDLRKKSEAEQQRLMSILEVTPDFVGIADKQGMCLYLNKAGREMLGIGADEDVCGIPINSFHPQAVAKLIMDVGIPAAIEQGIWSNESEFLARDGHIFLTSQVVLAHRSEQGEVEYFSTVARDITEREQMLNALRDSEQRFHTVARVSPVGIYQTDRQGGCVYVNQRWTEITGISAASAMGDGWTKTLHPLDSERIFAEWRLATEQHRPFQSEYRFRRPDNSTVWVFGQAAAILDDEGNVDGYVGTITDISEYKRVQQQLIDYRNNLEKKVEQRTNELQEMNQELEAFSYSVSHDLRAPLRAISGFSHILLEDYQDRLDDSASHYLSRINAGVLRMGAMIDDLLRISRTTRGEVDFEVTDLSLLAREMLEELRQAEPDRKVETRIAQDVQAMGDPRLLSNVMQNLMENAWKFTSACDPAEIEFGAESQGDSIVCYVRDNGAGFDMQYADKLFGVFQRLHAVNEYHGTGVGLAIVQRIIHRHGGRIWAESEVGKGATFYFSLPAVVRHNNTQIE